MKIGDAERTDRRAARGAAKQANDRARCEHGRWCARGLRGRGAKAGARIPLTTASSALHSLRSTRTQTLSATPRARCWTHSEFYKHFRFLVDDLIRVLKPGRLLSFHCMNLPMSKERDGVIGIWDFRGELIRIFMDAGFIFHSEVVIWKDPVTAMQRTKALGLLYEEQLRKEDSAMSRQEYRII